MLWSFSIAFLLGGLIRKAVGNDKADWCFKASATLAVIASVITIIAIIALLPYGITSQGVTSNGL